LQAVLHSGGSRTPIKEIKRFSYVSIGIHSFSTSMVVFGLYKMIRVIPGVSGCE
jgi:hypothetical protein